jgi:uncharacterized protein (TIGR02300 family)
VLRQSGTRRGTAPSRGGRLRFAFDSVERSWQLPARSTPLTSAGGAMLPMGRVEQSPDRFRPDRFRPDRFRPDRFRPDRFRVAHRSTYRGPLLPKPELGTKRTCLACGARFYDFGKTVEIACPACGAAFDLEQLARARRPRNPVRAVAAASAKEAVAETDEDEIDETVEADEIDDEIDEVDETEADAEEEPDVPVTDDDEEEDDPLIEDADELGDDDALGEVIDPEVGEDDDRR